MKWVLVVLAACGGGSIDPGNVNLPDGRPAPQDQQSEPLGDCICQLLTQAGAGTGEKCTWLHAADTGTGGEPPLGAIGCAPNGTVAVGGACSYATVANGGYDDCVAGSVCIAGTCEVICDNNGTGGPTCGSGQACVTHDGVFANHGATTIPAGECEASCDPLADNDFDGSGTRFTKSGSACGSDPTVGCYGIPSSSHTTYFTCATPVAGTEQLTHRSVVPPTDLFVNVCMPGYELGEYYADDSGANTYVCLAWCKPGDAYMGNPNANAPNGVAPHRCNTDDALGAFGTPASDTQNGEHCTYSWVFEIDDANAFHRSPTSDTLGICIDHTKYNYDPDGTGTPTTPIPACSQLPLASASAVGCVNSHLANLPQRPRHWLQIPELHR